MKHFISLVCAIFCISTANAAPFHDAARQGALSDVKALVSKGVDINLYDDRDLDALTIAARRGDDAIVHFLLENGANPANIVAHIRGTSLIAASHRGHVEVVKLLITAGAPLNHQNDNQWSALLEVVILGDDGERYQKIASALLKAGADPTLKDRDGLTALDIARANGFDKIVTLIEKHQKSL